MCWLLIIHIFSHCHYSRYIYPLVFHLLQLSPLPILLQEGFLSLLTLIAVLPWTANRAHLVTRNKIILKDSLGKQQKAKMLMPEHRVRKTMLLGPSRSNQKPRSEANLRVAHSPWLFHPNAFMVWLTWGWVWHIHSMHELIPPSDFMSLVDRLYCGFY